MSVTRVLLVAAALIVAANAQASQCPTLSSYGTFFFNANSTRVAGCAQFHTLQSQLCGCINGSGTNPTSAAGASCLENTNNFYGNATCGRIVQCLNQYFTSVELLPSQSATGCSDFTAAWTAGVLNAVLTSPTNFSQSNFAKECASFACNVAEIATMMTNYCVAEFGGSAATTICNGFSVFGTTTTTTTSAAVATNATTNATTTTRAATTLAPSTPATTTTAAPTAAPTTKSSASHTAAVLAIVAAAVSAMF